MQRCSIALLFFLLVLQGSSQQTQKPRLVVGIVVDQMRWDYLYRYQHRFAEDGGFKRLLQNGFNCSNSMIPYTPSYTANGHASIYTGTVPSVHGITGNNWFDLKRWQYIYCTDDSAASTIGSTTTAGKMSPVNMLSNTICDELKTATNNQAKVIGIALKDRGGILPAGHKANAAYWYDSKTGNFITSSYYMPTLPGWVQQFNEQKLIDSFYKQGWDTYYPIETYTQSTADENTYEVKTFGKGFPYILSSLAGKNYNLVMATPHGNSLTTQFSMSAVANEQLGADSITDFLAISYSSTDYAGHTFGPNAVEMEDMFIRLDLELAELLNYLDQQVGKDEYLLFLSADHGAAHNPAFMKDQRIPAGNMLPSVVVEDLNKWLQQKFDVADLVIDFINYQVILNMPLIEQKRKLSVSVVANAVVQYLLKQEAVQHAFVLADVKQAVLPGGIRQAITNGYYKNRSGHIQVVGKPQYIEGFEKGGTTHGLWNPYDTHVPLLWYGWHIAPGVSYREMYITDIAPTLAALLGIQQPKGYTGTVIQEIVTK
ncbi:MAG: alkaline phosphatase family protein [Chitinophagaceae bacterium]|jgi:predicted AlkP superfamily pyrophosphatase or phosphodiesterase|nr:alkaline phosphatase family protein [Chitinophagaceae bacterium]